MKTNKKEGELKVEWEYVEDPHAKERLMKVLDLILRDTSTSKSGPSADKGTRFRAGHESSKYRN
jgi:hypothetical protein